MTAVPIVNTTAVTFKDSTVGSDTLTVDMSHGEVWIECREGSETALVMLAPGRARKVARAILAAADIQSGKVAA